MANVFKQVVEPNNKINKSSFDLSFQNNLTMQFGYLYPCFCKKVAPGTKLKIKPTFGLNFMPMMFPVQTRMRARMSFYKVRIRSVWKDYKDWFGNLKPNLVKPYIDFSDSAKLKAMASTGSLGDYLGLPTTVYRDYGSVPSMSLSQVLNGSSALLLSPVITNPPNPAAVPDFGSVPYYGYSYQLWPGSVNSWSAYLSYLNSLAGSDSNTLLDFFTSFSISTTNKDSQKRAAMCVCFRVDSGSGNFSSLMKMLKPGNILKFPFDKNNLGFSTGDGTANVALSFGFATYSSSSSVFSKFLNINSTFLDGFKVPDDFSLPSSFNAIYVRLTLPNEIFGSSYSWASWYGTETTEYYAPISEILSTTHEDASFFMTLDSADSGLSDISVETSPYYNSNSTNRDKQLLIDACPFRAYEAIYNAYFRDIRNNPFILNGQPEYNVFIPSDEGGVDNNIYTLRRRNWEPDFLTTAVPSPQQGRAPLVGITTYNDTASLAFETEDGKKYSVAYDYDPEAGEMKNVSFQQLADDAVVQQPRNMMDLVASGISISDLRNVNAYTKFLELNMRKGYFYKDLVEGHFDTKVRYDELNMPEFIGGTAKDVFVNPVSQTVQTSQDGSYFGALGSYAGQASVQGTADNTISVYCDEECYIIGLISVTPVANYSQLLPKHFLHRDLLDSYFPEFDNIGFQPIFYDEVCPIQAYNDNPDTLKEIFGYQRPWYDYVASTDEVHGLFRTNLRNFLINRVFSTKPTLSEDFLLVDPEQVNDVFSVTQETDKILGQIYFDVTAVAPISRIAIPRLD